MIYSAQAYRYQAVSSGSNELDMFEDTAKPLDNIPEYPLEPLEEELLASPWSNCQPKISVTSQATFGKEEQQSPTSLARDRNRFPRQQPKRPIAPRPKFWGEVVIDDFDDALSYANELSQDVPDVDLDNTLVLWTDASVFPNLKLAGAAVTYKQQPTSSEWVQRMFTLSPTCSSNTGELFAIIAAMGIAADMVQKRVLDSDAPRRVIIFSDCMSLLNAILTPRSAKKCASGGGLMVKMTEKSLEIYSAGVQLELRWVPGHSGNHGNQRAHILARRAAKSGYKKAPPAYVAVLRASGMRMREIVMRVTEKKTKPGKSIR